MEAIVLLPICIWLLFSMFVADLGKHRTIGYWPSFLLSVILSPLIGFIITLLSPSEVRVIVADKPKESTGPQKVCPDCAEDVKQAARKCKHCGYRWN